jgi:hypothetical protein
MQRMTGIIQRTTAIIQRMIAIIRRWPQSYSGWQGSYSVWPRSYSGWQRSYSVWPRSYVDDRNHTADDSNLPTFFLFWGPHGGPGSPHFRVFTITHRQFTLGRILWTSDQLVAENSTWQHTTITTDRHAGLPPGFEPTLTAYKWRQTYA